MPAARRWSAHRGAAAAGAAAGAAAATAAAASRTAAAAPRPSVAGPTSCHRGGSRWASRSCCFSSSTCLRSRRGTPAACTRSRAAIAVCRGKRRRHTLRVRRPPASTPSRLAAPSAAAACTSRARSTSESGVSARHLAPRRRFARAGPRRCGFALRLRQTCSGAPERKWRRAGRRARRQRRWRAPHRGRAYAVSVPEVTFCQRATVTT